MYDAKYIGLDVHQATISQVGQLACIDAVILVPSFQQRISFASRRPALAQRGAGADRAARRPRAFLSRESL
jgi:hypothetical protein